MMNDTGSLANRYQQGGGFWGTPSDPNRTILEALDRIAGLLERLIEAQAPVADPSECPDCAGPPQAPCWRPEDRIA